MILQNSAINNIIKTGESDTKQASINQNKLAKLSYILTTGLYKNPISAVIVELSNNAIDSVLESGKDINEFPVIVELKNENNNYWIEFKDKGLGLSLKTFENVVMSYLTSTKEENVNAIGHFGIGCKATLALERPAEWTIRKDGKEHKLLFYKGNEFAEYDLLTSKDTEEENGVTIKVNINSWSEYSDFKYAAKNKLAFYDGIVLIIDNQIVENKIFRNDLFQWSTMSHLDNTSLCLKDVLYDVDFKSLGIPKLNLPIALRFNLSDGFIPTPSRESYITNEFSKNVLLNKFKEVANYFITKYNENTLEKKTFFEAYPFIGKDNKYVTLAEKTFLINEIVKYGDIPLNELKVKGITECDLSYYKRCEHFFPNFNVIVDNNYNSWKTKHLYIDTKSYLLNNSRKIVIVDKFPERKVKSFLQEKYEKEHVVIVKESKHSFIRKVKNIKKYGVLDTKAKLKEFLFIENQLKSNFIYELNIENSKEFIDWDEKRKQFQKEQRKLNIQSGLYESKSLNKQEGDITLAYASRSSSRIERFFTFEAQAYSIKNLYKNPYLTILFDKEEKEFAKQFANENKNKHLRVALIGKREKTKLPNLHNFKFLSDMLTEGNKKFRQIITAGLINDLSLDMDEIQRIESLKPYLNKFYKKYLNLINYKNQHNLNVSGELWDSMKVIAKEQNLFDYSIYNEYLEVKNEMDLLDFASMLKDPNWRETLEVKQKRDKVISRFLLFAKKYKNGFDNFELVEKKEEPILEEIL